jgi:hypothetical protein
MICIGAVFVAHAAIAAEIENGAVNAPVAEKPASNPTAGVMPTVNAEALSERKVILPRDLPGERTLVLIAFEREQQKNVDTWVTGLNLTKSSIPWIETPVIDAKNPFVQAMINGGMRTGISDPAMRDRTITLYTSRNQLIEAMKFDSGQSTIYAAVVDRKGKVWATSKGDYSAEKAAPLLAALDTRPETAGKQ